MSQPGGSYHVLNAFTTPAYAYHDCVKTPGKSCFYGGVASHTLPMCPTLNRANLSATQCRTWDVTREIIPSAKVPVVGYGTISMLENMSSRDQVDDIRPCTLRLNFGLHRPDIQFSLFSVRQASDDDITVRLPASVMCETTTFIGDVLNAPNNAMDLYSFISKPKFVPTHPHHWESLHISDLTRFRAMMA
ncbi:hypothetical protein B5M09_011476 [Aphanomyces astaci]|uniref:Uncharacterized protein n=1 Tax=Aphanomyces astaci TaxID=112090 RepID=A0A3R7WDX9_APHAT|nr:hypothetical protein B5M09_011476 [Aphanomyces astaci]